MRASELRIGNLVECTPDQCYSEIYGIRGNNIWLKFIKSQTFYIHELKPVELTEELLLSLGFISNAYQDRYENKAIHVECRKTRGYTELFIERMPHIKYAHQLQNLYFALTGEELLTP